MPRHEDPHRASDGAARRPPARAWLELRPKFAREEAFKALDGFSHVWILFVFHQDCLEAGWKPTVRPPRLGGRESVGVFASRAPYRPNPIGLSAVKHLGLVRDTRGLALRLRGIDMLDGTPVLDIKPYVPYADCLPEARGGFAVSPSPEPREVRFSPAADADLERFDPDGTRALRALVTQVLEQDPRPGYMDRYPERRTFGLRLMEFDIRWRLETGYIEVCAIHPAT
ncbi:MAG: tRNA (N6-threonylcarbamoyladenosine(37)-N6)-methyltransferase TrmO [Thermochromatium sp.]